jgi:hypothetical protein
VPFNQVSTLNRVQFRITDLAGNVGTSPIYSVTTQAPSFPTDTSAPNNWQSLSPSSTSDTTPTCTITVIDMGSSGLNVASAQYRYSRNGGYTWSGWIAATCTGANGTTTRQTISAPDVPFNQYHWSRNRIQFRITDMAGNRGQSSSYRVNTAP